MHVVEGTCLSVGRFPARFPQFQRGRSGRAGAVEVKPRAALPTRDARAPSTRPNGASLGHVSRVDPPTRIHWGPAGSRHRPRSAQSLPNQAKHGGPKQVRFPPPPQLRSVGKHFPCLCPCQRQRLVAFVRGEGTTDSSSDELSRANHKPGSNETPFSGPRKGFTIRPRDDRSTAVSEPIAQSG
jgi:hypothetical protein